MKEVVKRQNSISFWTDKLFLLILALYPFRHVTWGGDLMDVGYNYANYRYMGTDHMDSMWLYSTWLSNLVGHFFTVLPGGHTLLGMNIYTGLFAMAIGLLAYLFCTRVLRYSSAVVFVGEFLALSLCWCPTALLYNYMTYLLVLICLVLLYLGLTKEKKSYFILAGICLGSNIFVRFSNLAEVGYIVVVWVYDAISCIETKKRGEKTSFWQKTLSHTGWCLLGYSIGAGIWMLIIAIAYGPMQYVNGIQRLFAMTESAEDYKASAMVISMIKTYLTNAYWWAKLLFVAAEGVVLCLYAQYSEKWKRNHRIVISIVLAAITAGLYLTGKFRFLFFWCIGESLAWKIGFTAGIIILVISACLNKQNAAARWIAIVMAVLAIRWLYPQGFSSFRFYSYDAMILPATLLLMLAMAIAAIRFFTPKVSKEEKLMGVIVVMMIILTAIGSNNGIYPSINNMFLVIPYVITEGLRLISFVSEREEKWYGTALYPVMLCIVTFSVMCLVQFAGFGKNFSFCEGTGIRNADSAVENNHVLRGIKMSAERADWLRELTAYAEQENLIGREVILLGRIPAVSFYLEMPSAFNPWSDLDSYGTEVFKEQIMALNGEKPVIILEKEIGTYINDQTSQTIETTFWEGYGKKTNSLPEKTDILIQYMKEKNYRVTFENEKFMVFQ